MYGILETISTKAKMAQRILKRDINCVVQLTKDITRALPFFFQKHVILSMRITKKISFSDDIWQIMRLDQANPTGKKGIFERCTTYHTITVRN